MTTYLQHARRHLPGGTDPLTLPDTDVPSAIFDVGIVGFTGAIPVALGANAIVTGFAQLNTNRPDLFFLKGASAPYKGKIPAGFYHWSVELNFQDVPHLLAVGTNQAVFSDYGQFYSYPVYSGGTIQPVVNQILITPGETIPFVASENIFEGYLQAAAGVSDLELQVSISKVINTGVDITGARVNLAKLSDFLPDESSNIVP